MNIKYRTGRHKWPRGYIRPELTLLINSDKGESVSVERNNVVLFFIFACMNRLHSIQCFLLLSDMIPLWKSAKNVILWDIKLAIL